jgi:hypothetical protein
MSECGQVIHTSQSGAFCQNALTHWYGQPNCERRARFARTRPLTGLVNTIVRGGRVLPERAHSHTGQVNVIDEVTGQVNPIVRSGRVL